MDGPGTVVAYIPDHHNHLIPYLAAIHASCITHDRTIATFIPPLTHEKLLSWWKGRIAEISEGTRMIFMLAKELDPGGRPKGPEVMGVVMLYMPYSETGSLRAVVENLLVHKSHRWRGGARALMTRLEREALERGKKILTLEMELGSPAEFVWRQFGYIELGSIPNLDLSPTGELKDCAFLYKRLAL